MAENGWIKLHRQISSHDLWLSEKFSKGQAWVDLLLLASHKPQPILVRGIKISLEKGEFCRSLEFLAARWFWSKVKTSNYLLWLVHGGLLGKKVVYKISVYTVTNWDKYQNDDPQTSLQKSHKLVYKSLTQYKNVKNNRDINISHDSKIVDEKKPNRGRRCPNPLGHPACIATLEEIQVEFGKRFTSFAKQIMAWHMILRAGYTDVQVEDCVNEMDRDPFWRERGWDMMDVSNKLGKGGERYGGQKKINR